MSFGWTSYEKAHTEVTPQLQAAMATWSPDEFRAYLSHISTQWKRDFIKDQRFILAFAVILLAGSPFMGQNGEKMVIGAILLLIGLATSLYSFIKASRRNALSLAFAYTRATQPPGPTSRPAATPTPIAPPAATPRAVEGIGTLYSVLGGLTAFTTLVGVVMIFAIPGYEGLRDSVGVGLLAPLLVGTLTFLAGRLCISGKRAALYLVLPLLAAPLILPLLAPAQSSSPTPSSLWPAAIIGILFYGLGALILKRHWETLT